MGHVLQQDALPFRSSHSNSSSTLTASQCLESPSCRVTPFGGCIVRQNHWRNETNRFAAGELHDSYGLCILTVSHFTHWWSNTGHMIVKNANVSIYHLLSKSFLWPPLVWQAKSWLDMISYIRYTLLYIIHYVSFTCFFNLQITAGSSSRGSSLLLTALQCLRGEIWMPDEPSFVQDELGKCWKLSLMMDLFPPRKVNWINIDQ